MSPDHEKQLARSWEANAAAWKDAVRQKAIPSRNQGTDAAIVYAVISRQPRRVLDLGCGEGWLARELNACGVEVVGVDASAPLIEMARGAGGGTFRVCSYADIVASPDVVGAEYDAIVCNFALLEEHITSLLQVLSSRLAPHGQLLIQTIHPWNAGNEEPYRDGWRTETFDGFGSGFREPMPWYFRTLESWVQVLDESGFRIVAVREPLHPSTGQPLSLLLMASVTHR